MSDKLTPQEYGAMGGAPEKPIDYKQLEKLCAIHCTGEECASLLNCSYEHLNNKLKEAGHGGFLEFFKKHSASGKASLRRRQYKAAVEDGNVPMMIWLGKQYLDQHDSSKSFVDVNANIKSDVRQISKEMSAEDAATAYADMCKGND